MLLFYTRKVYAFKKVNRFLSSIKVVNKFFCGIFSGGYVVPKATFIP